LTPTSYLCGAEGPDGTLQTADDVVLLVTGVGATPTVTPISVPYQANFSGHLVRLSATRVLANTAGADGVWTTADDAVLLLDQLGSGNTVTPIVVGGIDDGDGWTATPLTTDSAVLATTGPDLTASTADDTLALLQDLGGANTVISLAAPRLEDRRGRPTALSPTSLLVPSNGPDAARRTADDQVYLFTGVGTTNTRADLAVPYLFRYSPRTPIRFSATRAVVVSAGADGAEETADDALMLLDRLGTTNTITAIPIPRIQNFGSGMATPLSESVAVLGSLGPDGSQETADDQVAIVTGLGSTNTVTLVTVGGMDEDVSSRPVRLSPTRVAFGTGGQTNPRVNGVDDEVVVISGVGTTNALTRVPIPGISFSGTSLLQPLSASAFVISHGGPDGTLDAGGDDQMTLVSGIGGTVAVESVSAAAEFNTGGNSGAPQWLGRGRAVAVSQGADGTFGAGNDDVMRVMTGLPLVRGIGVKKAAVTFNESRPTAIESFSASGIYATDDATLLEGSDLTVSVGNTAQTIPASRIKRSRTGVLSYADPKHVNGPLTKVTIDPRKLKFSISGRGTSTGIRTTAPTYVPVAIEADGIYVSEVVAARALRTGLKFP
jgi:hypothetical protein